jgi:hypothetical protein
MKLSVTEYEREQLAVARQVVDELNANLAGRGAGFRFAVTLAGKGVMPADLDSILAAAGDEPCG